MSKYVEKNLIENEEIIKKVDFYKLNVNFILFLGCLFFFLLFIPLIMAICKYVKFTNQELAVTNKRVIAKRGVFNTVSYTAPLSKVQNITITQDFWGKVFKYSTIDINTAQEGENAFKFRYVKEADKFKALIHEQMEKNNQNSMNEQILKMAAALVQEQDKSDSENNNE